MLHDYRGKAIVAPTAEASEQTVHEFMRSAHAIDVADWLNDLPLAQVTPLLSSVPLARRADVCAQLSVRVQAELAERMDTADLDDIVRHMDPDDRADLFNRLAPPGQDRLAAALEPVEREELRRLAAYVDGTTGSIMTTRYAALDIEQTTQQARETLRRTSPDHETIYVTYVLDADAHLVGAVSLHAMVMADDDTLVGDIMEPNPVSIAVGADQEEAASLISRYDLPSLPVVDRTGTLLGIVTHDDATDAMQRETTEDFQRISTVRPFAQSMRDAGVLVLYSKRIPWLALLVFGNVFSGAGIAFFEETILSYVALIFFLPLLIDSSGNAGSQAATLMVRALATGDVRPKDWRNLLRRELLISTLLGATMVLVVYPLSLFRGGAEIALVVGITMFVIVIIGSLVGMSLPFALSRLGLDPATASGPLVTTISDALGVLIYFSVATVVLT